MNKLKLNIRIMKENNTNIPAITWLRFEFRNDRLSMPIRIKNVTTNGYINNIPRSDEVNTICEMKSPISQ